MDTHNNVGVRRAAVRKLEHEMGLNTVKIEDLKLVGRFLYKADYNGEWAENELDYVLILPNCPIESVKPNTDEVEMIRAVSVEELDKMMEMDTISPWFRMLYNAGWISKWWRNLKNLDGVADWQTIHRLNG